MALDAVIGQERARGFLHSALSGNRLGHAYLFTGPPGVGKFFTALETAKALFCRAADARPCGQCPHCRQVEHDRHADVMVVQALEDKRVISIDQTRETGRFLATMPIQSDRRLVVIRDADMMTQEASNQLLKTLEEPAASGMLILTTARPSALLPTIRSRCQDVRFAPLTPEQVQRILLERPDLSNEDAALAARFAGGSVGRALEILDSGALEIYDRALPRALALPDENPFALADDVCDWARSASKSLEPQRFRVREFLRLLQCAYRDLLLLRLGAEAARMIQPGLAETAAPATQLSPQRLLRIHDALWRARRQTDANAEISLALQDLFDRIAELQTV